MQLSFTGFNFDELTPLNLLRYRHRLICERDDTLDALRAKRPFDMREFDRVLDASKVEVALALRAYEQMSRAVDQHFDEQINLARRY